MYVIVDSFELKHHGIMGQKWGVRHGPPYPLSGGNYKYKKAKRKDTPFIRKKEHEKKHVDKTITSGTTMTTLSYDKNRTTDVDMFYAATGFFDKKQYEALFNTPVPKVKYYNGIPVGVDYYSKFKINNVAKKDIKVASEDSGAEIFKELYKNDRDFYNFVTDEKRLEAYFDSSRYKFKGYREARDSLKKAQAGDSNLNSEDLDKIYRMFNYSIPYDGAGNEKNANDMALQRAKFFKKCKENGYGAILDTNDALYGGFKADSPVIVIDMKSVIPDKISKTKLSDHEAAVAIYAMKKLLGR